jgi:cold shock CspA family protein
MADGPVDGIPHEVPFCDASALPKGIGWLQPGERVEFTTRRSRTAGKPPEAKIVRVIETDAAIAA